MSTRKKGAAAPVAIPSQLGTNQRQLPAVLAGMFVEHSLNHLNGLKEMPAASLKKLRQARGSIRDWANIQFRLAFGLFLVKNVLHMEDEAASVVLPLNEAVVVNQAVMHRAKRPGAQGWVATPMEAEMIDEALDYISQIQDQVDPEDLQMAFSNAVEGFKTSMIKIALKK